MLKCFKLHKLCLFLIFTTLKLYILMDEFKTAEAAGVFPKAHVIDVLGVCCVSPVCCLVFFFMIVVLVLILYRKVPLCCKMRVYQESHTDMVRKIPFIKAFILSLSASGQVFLLQT